VSESVSFNTVPAPVVVVTVSASASATKVMALYAIIVTISCIVPGWLVPPGVANFPVILGLNAFILSDCIAPPGAFYIELVAERASGLIKVVFCVNTAVVPCWRCLSFRWSPPTTKVILIIMMRVISVRTVVVPSFFFPEAGINMEPIGNHLISEVLKHRVVEPLKYFRFNCPVVTKVSFTAHIWAVVEFLSVFPEGFVSPEPAAFLAIALTCGAIISPGRAILYRKFIS